jgi:5S rRNA maturation endonuclease (ribonuclease M5)
MRASNIAARLKAKKSGNGKWTAKCPAHKDENPSLSISEGQGGRTLLKCHAGCTLESILGALGLTAADISGADKPNGPGRKKFVTYDYCDPSGKILYQAVRYLNPKGFKQRRPDGKGGWIWNMEGVTKFPFNLPELLRSNVVLIAEGEKDANNLQKAAADFPNEDGKIAYAATTNIGGAGKWLEDYSPFLAGKDVYVLPDNDEPGRRHAQQVCASVAKHAQAVHLVELPGLPDKGDVSDYLNFHTPAELFALIEAAPMWTQPVAATYPSGGLVEVSGLRLKCGTSIADKHQEWLVPKFIPADTLIVLAGQVGLGKTTAALSLAASISSGSIPIIGGRCEPRNVLVLSNEDPEAHLRKTFVQLGGNLAHLYVEDEESDLPWGLENIPALEAHLNQLQPSLVIIDSLSTHKPSKCDLNSHGEIGPVLVGLRKAATKFSCSVVVIHHLNKLKTSDPLDKISGSVGISATARHVFFVGMHPEDEGLRVIAVAKSNLAKPGELSYQFRLDPFGWEGESEYRAEDLLPSPEVREGSVNAADVFLRTLLAAGPKTTKEIVTTAAQNGITRAALYRAKARLGIIGKREEFQGTATWALPNVSSSVSATRSETLGELSERESSNHQCLQGPNLESLQSQLSHSPELRI